jgi:hypothetical protein
MANAAVFNGAPFLKAGDGTQGAEVINVDLRDALSGNKKIDEVDPVPSKNVGEPELIVEGSKPPSDEEGGKLPSDNGCALPSDNGSKLPSDEEGSKPEPPKNGDQSKDTDSSEEMPFGGSPSDREVIIIKDPKNRSVTIIWLFSLTFIQWAMLRHVNLGGYVISLKGQITQASLMNLFGHIPGAFRMAKATCRAINAVNFCSLQSCSKTVRKCNAGYVCQLTFPKDTKDPVTAETRFFLTSVDSPQVFALSVRRHRKVEVAHFLLDYAFSDDSCRLGVKSKVAGFQLCRKLALLIVCQYRAACYKNKKSFNSTAEWLGVVRKFENLGAAFCPESFTSAKAVKAA